MNGLEVQPLPEARFGGLVQFRDADEVYTTVSALEADARPLLNAFYESHGLLVLKGMLAIIDDPMLLLRLSRLFGPEVENYRETLTPESLIHETVDEIFVLASMPPSDRKPPDRPDPPVDDSGRIPVQFPHRKGWHTDQSFRRPPPDVSLFYSVVATPNGQGQTLYADGISACQELSPELRQRCEGLEGWHVYPWAGRSEREVRAGVTPQELLAHQQPQRQPVIRTHPVTGEPAMYLCEDAQMDWVVGPFVDMATGPDSEGGKLLYELMSHMTERRFTYTHEWDSGDLVIHDNRSTIHSATWFDSDKHQRHMWRTTVRGNAGEEYAGEKRSWIPEPGVEFAAGLKG